MKIFVGSKNPVKINAVINAGSETWPDLEVEGFEVPSGIAEQPMSDDETRKGASNRAKAALAEGIKAHSDQKYPHDQVLGIGMEGGVFELNPGELWSTVWVSVIDQNGNLHESCGARFKVPTIVAKKILAGEEMGPIVAQVAKTPDVRSKQGMIGVITNNFVDRTESYVIIAKLALGLWYGRHWHREITST